VTRALAALTATALLLAGSAALTGCDRTSSKAPAPTSSCAGFEHLPGASC
jgi:hypothetical protein